MPRVKKEKVKEVEEKKEEMFVETDSNIIKDLKKIGIELSDSEYYKYKEVLVEYFPKIYRELYGDLNEFFVCEINHSGSDNEKYVTIPLMVFDDVATPYIGNSMFKSSQPRIDSSLYIFNKGLRSCFDNRINKCLVRLNSYSDGSYSKFKNDSGMRHNNGLSINVINIDNDKKLSIYQITAIMMIVMKSLSPKVINNDRITAALESLGNLQFVHQKFNCGM